MLVSVLGSGSKHLTLSETRVLAGRAKLSGLALMACDFSPKWTHLVSYLGKERLLLLKTIDDVHIAMIPQNLACDVMVKGCIKGQGNRYLFELLASYSSKITKEAQSLLLVIFFKDGAEAQ